MKAEIFS